MRRKMWIDGKISHMDLYWMIDRTMWKSAKTFWGNPAWSTERVFKVLADQGYVRLEFDRAGYFTGAVPLKEVNPEVIHELLWPLNWKDIKPLKLKTKKNA